VAQGLLEHATLQRMTAAFRSELPLPVTIPTVVHVVYSSAVENVSEAQINSQIISLNKDYGAENPERFGRALLPILASSLRWRKGILTAIRPTALREQEQLKHRFPMMIR
jgi:hypothetical protein